MSNHNYMKAIPIAGSYDVVVVGGGTAGVPAAVSSARSGLKTLIIEKNNCFGGMSTTGLVGPFMTCYDKNGKNQIVKGMFDEVVKRLIEKGGAIHPELIRAGTSYTSFLRLGHDHVTPFDSECLKLVWDEMLEQSGCECLLHTSFIDVVMEDDLVTGIIIHNKSGMQLVNAKIVIDCTGDADVVLASGGKATTGSGQNGKTQPATMFFRVDNVDTKTMELDAGANKDKIRPFFGLFSWVLEEKRKQGIWDVDREEICIFEGIRKGEYRVNTTRINSVDGTNPKDITYSEIEGRKQVQKVYKFMRENLPGFSNVRLMDTAGAVGFRETRHIEGEYEMKKEDILDGIIFEDRIALAATSIDIHSEGGKGGGEFFVVKNGDYFSIPYRSMLPKNLKNLIVAGRCISASKEAFAAIRMMTTCIVMGEAAGTAAGIAIKNNRGIKEIDVKELQKKLLAQGAVL